MGVKEKMLSIRKMCLTILEMSEKSKNCDQTLTLNLWTHFYGDKLFKDANGDLCIKLANTFDLPHQSSIVRERAYIQNDLNLLLPTDPSVLKKRHITLPVEFRDHYLA